VGEDSSFQAAITFARGADRGVAGSASRAGSDRKVALRMAQCESTSEHKEGEGVGGRRVHSSLQPRDAEPSSTASS